MNTIYDVVDLVILLVGITVVVYSSILISKCWKKWYLFLPLLLWAAHLSIFYFVVVHADFTDTTLDMIFNYPGIGAWWSTLQRLHGVLTMLFMTILLATEIKCDYFRTGCKDK